MTIEIEGNAEGCLVNVSHELLPEWSEFAEQTEVGWTATVKACGAFAASDDGANE